MTARKLFETKTVVSLDAALEPDFCIKQALSRRSVAR